MAGLDFGQLFVSLLVLIVSLTVHEAAHAWTADRLGDPTARMLGRLSLNPAAHIDPVGTIIFPLIALATGVPLIGWAKPVPVDVRRLGHPRRDFAVIAAAGPLSNLILALGFAVVFWTLPAAGGSGVPVVVANVVVLAVIVNVLLAVFNMIPVPPLDGGNVLAGILPEAWAAAFDRLRPYGFVILYALMLSGFLSTITRPVRNGILSWLLS